jgi:hypothetical protein
VVLGCVTQSTLGVIQLDHLKGVEEHPWSIGAMLQG